MCQRSIFARSCSRIAEEVQLQAEEEFILEALKKIKQQRNCLQIERLHLESLKLQLENPGCSSTDNTQTVEQKQNKETNPTHSKPTEMMSAVNMMTLGTMQHKDDFAEMDEDMECNNQELNLNLNPTSSCADTSKPTYSQYEYDSEDESESDASDGDNVMIDINMLMNGTGGCN